MIRDNRLQSYVDFFSSLSPDSLEHIDRVMTEDVYFSDPFNDVTGLDAARRIFMHMFRDLDDPVFAVLNAAISENDNSIGLLHWRLNATMKRKNTPLIIEGMSVIRFAADGRVQQHIDHWDAGRQIYESVPVLGAILRLLRSRLAG